MIVHRVLKITHIRGEKPPYSAAEIGDIAEYINVSRSIIEILGRDADLELRGRKIVSRLKKQNGNNLNVSHFTSNIRDTVSHGKKMPKLVVDEIINDLRNGEKSNWGWAIGVLLVSGNEDIKRCLKQVLLDEKKFRAKAVLAILNTTKVSTSDKNHLFEIIEEEKGNEFSITVKFRGEKVFRNSANYGKFEPSEAIGMVRNKALKRIVTHFCGK